MGRYKWKQQVDELIEPTKEFANKIAKDKDAPPVREVTIPVETDTLYGEYIPPGPQDEYPKDQPVGELILLYPSAFFSPQIITHEVSHHVRRTTRRFREKKTEARRELTVIQNSITYFSEYRTDYFDIVYPVFHDIFEKGAYPHSYKV